MQEMLKITGIRKSFSTLDVLKGVDLTVHKGEVVSLIGPSGSGKTTLLRCANFLDQAEDGTMVLDGQTYHLGHVRRTEMYEARRHTAFVFQNYNLFLNKTALQNVTEGLIVARKMPRDEAEARAQKALEKVGLGNRGASYPNQLSGGEQQRTALARIMAYEPDVILLDEPFSALDAYLRERMLTELMEILSDYEGTVIMVSHSRDEIYSFSEEVLVIEDGHGIRLGPVKEVFNAPRYKTAARLTGCKNIADVYRMDAQTVYVKDWDVQLIFKGRSVPENVKAIGIRAHDLIPVYGTISGAMLKVKEWKSVDYPFERKYFIQCESGCEDFCWFVQREISATLEEKGMPDALAFPEEKVLFLEG